MRNQIGNLFDSASAATREPHAEKLQSVHCCFII